MLIYGNFNDDKWHDVSIMRTSAISEIRVDNYTKTLVSSSTYTSSFFQDYIYIGGYDDSNLSQKTKNPIPLFVGCLKILELDDRDPIKYYFQGSQRIEIKPAGQQLLTGQCGKAKYNPIELTKFSSSLIFPYPEESVSGNQLILVRFSIRTFSSSGLILEAVGNKLEEYQRSKKYGMRAVIFDGYIHFKIWYSVTKWEVNIHSSNTISNGLWHEIEFQITQNKITFQLGGNSIQKIVAVPFSLQLIQKAIRFGGDLSERSSSKSFIGCLNHIHIQHQTFTDVMQNDDVIKNNIKEGCTLLDHCFPDPCLNGGICKQERNEGTCDCSATEFYGKFCEKPLYKASCSAYQKLGLNETSYCLIDSDGSGPLLPYTHLCEFSKTEATDGLVATVVHHNKEKEFSPLDGDETLHSYTFHRFNYDLDDKSIKSLIKYSRHCRQQVQFRCYNTALFNAPHGPSNIMWKTGSGQTKGYWGNVPSNFTGCECGVKKNCVIQSKQCNCDAMLNSWHEDVGYVTEKVDLPIMRLQVTGMKRGRSIFSIGPLECFGIVNEQEIMADLKAYTDNNLLGKSCVSISKMKKLIRTANDSAKYKLLKEKPLLTTTERTPSYFTLNANAKIHLETTLVRDEMENEQTGLSIVEIIFIGIAALATILLLIKFVFCALFRKLHGQITLNHEARFEDPGTFIAADTLAISSTLKKQNNGNDITCSKGCVKMPSNYWV